MIRLLDILSCPDCQTSLKKISPKELLCPRCQYRYQKIDNVYILLPQRERQKIQEPITRLGQKTHQNQEQIDWKFISYQYYIRYHRFIQYVNPIIKDDLVLDVGCASAPLSYNFKNYLGLDNSLKLVSFASQHIDQPILLADACSLPLRNHSVPFFVCRNLLEHTHDEMKIIDELKRVTQKGGFFELPCSDQISWILDPINLCLEKIGFSHLKAFTYGWGHINMLTLNQWRDRLQKGGFKIKSSQEIGKGLIFNLASFLESLILSYSDNDFIPAKLVSQKVYRIVSKFYTFLDKLDPKITKSWTRLFYVKN